MIDPCLKNKVVLITGANHGIGAATAKAFALQEAKVCISYYRERCKFSQEELNNALKSNIGGELLYRANQQKTAHKIIENIESHNKTAVQFETDLSNLENITALFDYCEKMIGPVDILINNHTFCSLDTFDPNAVTEEGFGINLISAKNIDNNFTVNTRAYALMMSEYVKRYLNRKGISGRIINISTDAAHAHELNVSYAASKHAIESYSRSAALELGKYGITVNIASIGPTQTGYLTSDEEKNIADQIPLRRIGKPEDIADVLLFLASEQARWLTGQLIYIGGGWRIHQ